MNTNRGITKTAVIKKICTKCHKVKNISGFYEKRGGWYKDKGRIGHASWCKECSKSHARKWAEENQERFLKRLRRWYDKNKETELEKKRLAYREDIEKSRARSRAEYQRNRTTKLAGKAEYRLKNLDKSKENNSKRVERLDVGYLRCIFTRDKEIRKVVPKEALELQRDLVILKRLMKEKKNGHQNSERLEKRSV